MKTNKIILKNAFLIFVGIVTYFFLMKLFGLENVSELRILNFAFVFWGINRAIRQSIYLQKETNYFANLAIGAATSALAVLMSIISLIIYVNFINPDFLSIIEFSFLLTGNLSIELVVFAIAIEGIASSVICSFMVIQLHKNVKKSELT